MRTRELLPIVDLDRIRGLDTTFSHSRLLSWFSSLREEDRQTPKSARITHPELGSYAVRMMNGAMYNIRPTLSMIFETDSSLKVTISARQERNASSETPKYLDLDLLGSQQLGWRQINGSGLELIPVGYTLDTRRSLVYEPTIVRVESSVALLQPQGAEEAAIEIQRVINEA